MGIRHWFRSHLLGSDSEEGDPPTGTSLIQALLGRDEERVRSLGEYRSDNYPEELAEMLRRRQEVTADVLRIDVTDPQARIQAIPLLQTLLRRYPHPLVYEMLIHAYVDAGRYDEARGVAFAARERRLECARSPHPEIRAETERLREWDPNDVEELRAAVEARRRR